MYEQHEALSSTYLNNLGLKSKGRSGSEDLAASKILILLICNVKFVHQRNDTMGISRNILRDKSYLLHAEKYYESIKVSKGRPNPVTK